jgi:hypothetical protein
MYVGDKYIASKCGPGLQTALTNGVSQAATITFSAGNVSGFLPTEKSMLLSVSATGDIWINCGPQATVFADIRTNSFYLRANTYFPVLYSSGEWINIATVTASTVTIYISRVDRSKLTKDETLVGVFTNPNS